MTTISTVPMGFTRSDDARNDPYDSTSSASDRRTSFGSQVDVMLERHWRYQLYGTPKRASARQFFDPASLFPGQGVPWSSADLGMYSRRLGDVQGQEASEGYGLVRGLDQGITNDELAFCLMSFSKAGQCSLTLSSRSEYFEEAFYLYCLPSTDVRQGPEVKHNPSEATMWFMLCCRRNVY